MGRPLVATYSIAACDLDAGHWGVATQSKFLAVGSVVPWAEPNVDLRVEDHERPLEELRRLYGLHQAIFGETPRDQWVAVDADLAEELRERLAKAGYEGELDVAFDRWAANWNLEERVDGVEEI